MADEAEAAEAMDAEAEEESPEVPEHRRWCWGSALAWIMRRHRRPADELMAAQPAGYGGLASVLAHADIIWGIPPASCTQRQAEEMLLSVLRGEKKGKKLISYGVPEGQLNDSVIPESDWSLLEPWNSPLGSIGAKTRSGVRPYRRYDTIILSADDVMRVWPAEGPQQESVTAEEAPPTTVAAIRRATEALANELNGNPDMKKLPDARDFCRQRGVSQRQFLRTIWKDAREKAGLDPKGRPGPKRKPKSNAVCSD